MTKKIEKKIDAPNGTLEIDIEQVDALLRSERWTADSLAGAVPDKTSVQMLDSLYEKPSLEVKTVDIKRLTYLSSEDIIDRFLRTEPRRIVAEEGEVEQEIVTQAEITEEEDFVSEELAEVYLAQGLKDMAKETYRKLSLLNPEKSIYFAEIISNIDRNN